MKLASGRHKSKPRKQRKQHDDSEDPNNDNNNSGVVGNVLASKDLLDGIIDTGGSDDAEQFKYTRNKQYFTLEKGSVPEWLDTHIMRCVVARISYQLASLRILALLRMTCRATYRGTSRYDITGTILERLLSPDEFQKCVDVDVDVLVDEDETTNETTNETTKRKVIRTTRIITLVEHPTSFLEWNSTSNPDKTPLGVVKQALWNAVHANPCRVWVSGDSNKFVKDVTRIAQSLDVHLGTLDDIKEQTKIAVEELEKIMPVCYDGTSLQAFNLQCNAIIAAPPCSGEGCTDCEKVNDNPRQYSACVSRKQLERVIVVQMAIQGGLMKMQQLGLPLNSISSTMFRNRQDALVGPLPVVLCYNLTG